MSVHVKRSSLCCFSCQIQTSVLTSEKVRLRVPHSDNAQHQRLSVCSGSSSSVFRVPCSIIPIIPI